MTTSVEHKSFSEIWRWIELGEVNRAIQHPNFISLINAKQRGYTPLHLSIVKHHFHVTKALLEHGADPNMVSRKRTPLYMATLFDEPLTMSLLLDYGANVDTISGGFAPIHIAAARGILDACTVLTNAGANLDVISPNHGTAIHICIKKNHKYVAKFLLENGADPHATNEEGESCVYKACQEGNADILKLLLEKATIKGCSIPDKDGNTCLHVSALQGHFEIVSVLMERFPGLIPLLNNNGKSVMFYLPYKLRSTAESIFVKSLPSSVSFSKMVNNKNHSDTIITVENGVQLYAHSCILWHRWTRVRPLLETKQKGNFELSFPAISPNTMISFLHFLYSDRLVFPKQQGTTAAEAKKGERANDLAEFASEQGITYLAYLCDFFLEKYSMPITASTFQKDLEDLLASERASDIKIIPEREEGSNDDTQFAAHKAILSANCEYFQVMFNPTLSLRESSAKVIRMDISPPILKDLLVYLYTNKIPKKLGNTHMLEAATQFMLKELSIHCQIYLLKHINEENVYELFLLSDHLQANYLRESCLDYLIRCYPVAKRTDQFKNLGEKLIQEIASNFSDGLK